jgi:hypothetical protein
VTQATLRFTRPAKVEYAVAYDVPGMPAGRATLHSWNEKLTAQGAVEWKELRSVAGEPLKDAERSEWKLKPPEWELKADHVEVLPDKVPLDVEVVKDDTVGTIYFEAAKELRLKLYEPAMLLEHLEGAAPIVGIRAERVSDEVAREVLARAGLAVGQTLTRESGKQLQEAAQSMDEHFHIELEKKNDGVVITLVAR